MPRMMYGAITVGQRSAVDACSTVEARTIDGRRVVLLATVQGQLATPALETVKGAFAKVTQVDAAAAAKLVASGLPAPYATGIGVVLITGDHAYAAASGGARCHRVRGGALEALAPGAFDLLAGDTIVSASHPDTPPFVLGALPLPTDDEFHNGRLDDALTAALEHHRGLLSVAVGHASGV